MKFFDNPWKRISDDEYIDSIRRTVAASDRIRLWVILFNIGLILVLLWIYSQMILLLARMLPQVAPFLISGFLLGTILGVGFGTFLSSLVHNLFNTVGGCRTERLLLQHIDAQEAEQSEWSDDNDNLDGE